jgi:5-methyltetrahydrofolate--homocysteine methyltransferase
VKIEPHYDGATVHVLDASKSVTVASSLITDSSRDAFVSQKKEEYKKIRTDHAAHKSTARYFTIEEARKNKLSVDWQKTPPAKPNLIGIKTFLEYPLKEIAEKIDWSPFFHTWEIRGRYPQIFQDKVVGVEAKKLFDDAQALLKQIVDKKLLTANGVIGLFPANSNGDDIEVYADEKRNKAIAVFHTLRQQIYKTGEDKNAALSDYIAPKSSGIPDYIGGFAVTTGIGGDELAKSFEKKHDDYSSIMSKALADRLAEAFAELLHERVRKEFWGYSKAESLSIDDLIAEKYKGIRPAAGYPACPDHTEKRTLFDLLQAEKNTSIQLTESFAMHPGAAVSGLCFAHPQAKYFPVGKIEKDQIQDYAIRKGLDIKTVERWLAPNLNYDI